MSTKNSTYIILTIVLLILSAIGGYFLLQIYQGRTPIAYNLNTVPKIELVPTDSPQDSEIVQITPTIATETVTIIPTKIPTPTKITTPTITAISNNSTTKYSNSSDGFFVLYNPKRTPNKDTESSGNRYTFVHSSGNFAIHVSSADKWSWTHPNRQFTNSLIVSGQPTFKYEIATQTIVDLQFSDKNYTIQCVHNNDESVKTECDEFIASFQLL